MSTVLARTALSGLWFSVGFAAFVRPWADEVPNLKPASLTNQSIIAELEQNEEYQSLFTNSDFERSEASARIPRNHQTNHVSQGLLFGPKHLEIDPIFYRNLKTNELFSYYHLGKQLVGHDGKIHNGVIATLLDEGLCSCGFPTLPSKRGVTGRLTINFLNEVPPDSTVILRAKVKETKGRKSTIYGCIETVPLTPGAKPVAIADSECILIEPRWFKYFQWLPLFD